MISKIPNATLVPVRESEAFIGYDQPDQFDRELAKFVERVVHAE